MDSRDSSSSASMIVPKEVGSSADDEGLLSVTSLLANEASVLFQSEKYTECVQVLNRLLHKKEGDPKILQNIAVTTFLRDGCSDPRKLVEDLINIKRKSEDLAREQSEASPQASSKTVSGNKGSNNLANSACVFFVDEFDASVATLNIATALFHLHEYPKALSVLEPLFQNIEPIDETTAFHVCLLLLDVAFVTQDASKFSDVMNYVEKAFGRGYILNHLNSGCTGQQQPSHFVSKTSSISNNSLVSDDVHSDGAATGNVSQDSLSRTLSDDTMEYEKLLSTLDMGGQNLSRPSNLSSSSDLSRAFADRSTHTVQFKLQLPLYRIRLFLLTRKLKAAKREVKMAMNIVRGVDSSRTLILKSQLEYARGNYPKALKLLRASSKQTDVGSSILWNNIGCIYYQQGKNHTSSIFFHKALRNCSSLWTEKPPSLATFSQDKSRLIAYNCGIHHLWRGQPLLAARFFMEANLVFPNRPILWLRLAECCLMAWDMGLLKDPNAAIRKPVLSVEVVGHGYWRYLAVENDSSNEREDSPLDGSSKQKLSMSFARQYLFNAVHLLGRSELKHVKSCSLTKPSPKETESSQATAASKNSGQKNLRSNDPKLKDSASSNQVSANGEARELRGASHVNTMSEYEDVCRRENKNIRQTILIALAFVELELGNPLNALSTALSLLKLPECSRMYAFLAHVYAAEALCLLNNPKEAAEHIFTYVSGDNNVALPYTGEDCQQWPAKKAIDTEDSNTVQTEEQNESMFLSPEDARVALYVNLASLQVMQGNLEQAANFAFKAVTIAPHSREAALMSVYLDLKVGNSKEALNKLRQSFRVRYWPFTPRSKAAS